jgi:ABC-type polysaccharide/polyol phosphate transport system ATPase subunit
MTDKDIAIKVENISKTFRIPHEKISSLRGAFVNLLGDKGYEEFKALDNVSFKVKKGEFFGIIGRNGSGKSTLLKILAGIYKPDEGRVKINGLISPFLELGIGFNPELSGRDNIYLNAAVLGLTHKQIDEKFEDIVRFSELKRFIDQKVKNYSSGMQVRLAFSVAIHANRDILLMDEVLAVGDANFQGKCLTEFMRYKKLGKTVVLVTHDILTVQKYCDRAMLLREGKIKMIGDPGKVSSEYIYQNMTDEEKRILEEEKLRKIKEEKDLKHKKTEESVVKTKFGVPVQMKIAEVVKVDLLDREGNKKESFSSGETINVKVLYKIRKPITNPIFGIVINNTDNVSVFVTNTYFKKIKTGICQEGKVEVDFEIENNFAGGLFYVSPAVAAEKIKAFYDWRDNFKALKIVNNDYISGGCADFKHSIILSKKYQ